MRFEIPFRTNQAFFLALACKIKMSTRLQSNSSNSLANIGQYPWPEPHPQPQPPNLPRLPDAKKEVVWSLVAENTASEPTRANLSTCCRPYLRDDWAAFRLDECRLRSLQLNVAKRQGRGGLSFPPVFHASFAQPDRNATASNASLLARSD